MNESRTKNTIHNIILGLISQMFTLFLNFINRTIFIKILGVEYLGINGLFSDILMMLSMADLGFSTAMVYSFYKPLAEKKYHKIANLVKFYRKIYNFIAFIVAIIGLAILPFLEYLINIESNMPYIKAYYLLFLANTIISYLFVYKTLIIYADQKNYIISKYQMLVNFLKILFQAFFLLVTQDYFIYLFVQVISTILSNIIVSRKANELYPYLKESYADLDTLDKKSIYENMKSVAIYKISGVLLNSTDNILISILVGTIWVGIYSNYILAINALSGFINIIYSSTTASVGNVVVSEKPKKRFEIFQSMQTVSLILGSVLAVCIYLLINDFIYVWLGKSYILNNYIVSAIVLNFYLGIIIHSILSYREATGLYKTTKYIMLIAAIENLFLSFLMGYFIGIAGILFASAISRITTYYWYEPKILFEEYFNEPLKKYFIPLGLNVIFTIAMIAVFGILTERFIVDSWPKLIYKTVAVATISFILVVMVYHKTSGYKMIFDKIKYLYNA